MELVVYPLACIFGVYQLLHMAIRLFYSAFRQKFPQLAGAALLLPIIFFLTACQFQQSTLRVGTNIWPGYEPFYLARSLGYYDSSPIHLVELPSATAVIRHLNSGSIDAACLTLDEALSVISNNIDIIIIAALDTSHGADVLLGQPHVKSLDSLSGKTIGVEKTGVGAVLLDGALYSADLSLQDVKIKYLTSDQHEHAWNEKQIDAIVTYEPYRTRLLAAGAVQIFDSRQIPGRIVDVLVIKKEVLNNDAVIRALLLGYFNAVAYKNNHPQDAALRMSSRLGVAAKEVHSLFNGLTILSLEENKRLLNSEEPVFERTIQQLMNFMLEKKLLDKEPNLKNILTDKYLPDQLS